MSDKELLFSVTEDDCDWMYFCAGGKGGQHQNKTASACRCRHRASGAEGISRDHREQRRNKVEAFKRMANSEKFKVWHKLETSRRLESATEAKLRIQRIEDAVERDMRPENLKIEMKDEKGKWVEYTEPSDEKNEVI